MNPPLKSKINATALLTAIVTLALIGFGVSPEAKAQILTITSLAGPALIVVFRSWFTGP